MSGESRVRLKVNPARAVSPSFVDLLRQCMLRAGLSKAYGVEQYVLGNPKAWLGTAYHEVLAAAGNLPQKEGVQTIAQVWSTAIDKQKTRAQAHPLDYRFGEPERWLGYHLIHAMAQVRASELYNDASASVRAMDGVRKAPSGGSSEQWLTGADGRIVGRPDLIRGDAVLDFKTGSIYEYGEGDVVNASYVRQIYLYAFLIHETNGWWPARGVLIPMQGEPVEIDIDPATCESEVSEALSLLERYNEKVQAGGYAGSLATPSPAACCWCPYQIICPAYWESANPSWEADHGWAAVEGAAVEAPRGIFGGSALALTVDAQRGTGQAGIIEIAPIDSGMHTAIGEIGAGSKLRAVRLRRRADGSVTVTMQTVITSTEILPEIVLREGVEGADNLTLRRN
jgi:hypothetical protein